MIEKELIHSLTKDFENFANKTSDDVEFWLARDLQHLLGYTKWDNFQKDTSCSKYLGGING